MKRSVISEGTQARPGTSNVLIFSQHRFAPSVQTVKPEASRRKWTRGGRLRPITRVQQLRALEIEAAMLRKAVAHCTRDVEELRARLAVAER